MSDSRPIILTASMEVGAQSFFDERRERYFPADRNWLDAHITLFHALPGECHLHVSDILARQTASTTVIAASVTGIRNLGGGVAYVIRSDSLSAFRGILEQEFASWLTPQDRQKFNPHVTVQNKVTRTEARQTEAILAAEFSRFELAITGVGAWRYDGGPWAREADYAFHRSAT